MLRSNDMGRGLRVTTCAVAFVAGTALWFAPIGHEVPPVAFADPQPRPRWQPESSSPNAARVELLRHARVWSAVDPAATDVAANPADPSGFLSGPMVRCQYVSAPAHGTTTKFDCALPDGEVVKVKYGSTGEINAEVAATRLLRALGFGADRMFVIRQLRCYGCLRNPFYAVWALDKLHARELVTDSIPEDRYTDFEWVAVERRFEGIAVETKDFEGWAWFELEPSAAGRAERDALRLVAMLLAHWDNKASNQRLVVRPEPFAYIHDLGATFGPNKRSLSGWRGAAIWSDPATCTVSMKTMPYHGSTFPDARISEPGRRLLLRQLTALRDDQIAALFAAARFDDVSAWVRAFQEKVRQIAAAGPCE